MFFPFARRQQPAVSKWLQTSKRTLNLVEDSFKPIEQKENDDENTQDSNDKNDTSDNKIAHENGASDDEEDTVPDDESNEQVEEIIKKRKTTIVNASAPNEVRIIGKRKVC